MKLKICTLHPHGHTVSKETMETVRVLLSSEIPCFHQDYGCSGDVAKTRNLFVDFSQDWTHILMLDADISAWSVVSDVKRMLGRGHRIIAGVCPIHDDAGNSTYLSNAKLSATATSPAMRLPLGMSGIHEVETVGAAFMLLERSGLELIRQVEPEPDIQWQWFCGWYYPPTMSTPVGCSEDVGFCYRARRCGLKVWADCDARIEHHSKPLPSVIQNEIDVLLNIKDFLQHEIDTLTGQKVEAFNGGN